MVASLAVGAAIAEYVSTLGGDQYLLDDYGLFAFPETFFIRPDGRLSSWTQGELSEEEIEMGIRKALAG